jgi:hypothetical protein
MLSIPTRTFARLECSTVQADTQELQTLTHGVIVDINEAIENAMKVVGTLADNCLWKLALGALVRPPTSHYGEALL